MSALGSPTTTISQQLVEMLVHFLMTDLCNWARFVGWMAHKYITALFTNIPKDVTVTLNISCVFLQASLYSIPNIIGKLLRYCKFALHLEMHQSSFSKIILNYSTNFSHLKFSSLSNKMMPNVIIAKIQDMFLQNTFFVCIFWIINFI